MKFGINSFEEITREKILAATDLIRPDISPSPLEKIGPVLAKFESNNPTGAFKVRGGLVYFDWLKSAHPEVKTVICATRGNHGQSVAFAAGKAGLECKIIIPHGNSPSKNEAMREFEAEVIVHGRDFVDAMEFGMAEAEKTGAHWISSFDWKLVLGVSTYGYELFSDAPNLDAVFVPIGLGSGICGTIAARNAHGLNTKIIGVVAENAPTYALSFDAGKPVEGTEIPDTIADGVALRVPNPDSLSIIQQHVDSIVVVPESDIKNAIRELHQDHGLRTEGAAAISYAAWKTHGQAYKNPAIIISGGNIDDPVFDEIIATKQ